MWRNYVTVGLRALAKSKTYAFINIFGLAVGYFAALEGRKVLLSGGSNCSAQSPLGNLTTIGRKLDRYFASVASVA